MNNSQTNSDSDSSRPNEANHGFEHSFFAACPKGLEQLLADELTELGSSEVRQTVAGVYFNGDMRIAYKACLWSRLANKILMPLAKLDCEDADRLYERARDLPWEEYLGAEGSFKVDFIGTNKIIRNSQFGSLRIKDAVVDRLRDSQGTRPNVDKAEPDVLINARLSKGQVVVSLDLAGDSLHRRGYRTEQGAAPLKENLAAALLIRSGWPKIAAEGGALLDPMCGSGTFLIEAALIAADVAPGLYRKSFGFQRWLNYNAELWQELMQEAQTRRMEGLERQQENPVEIRGYDANVRVIRAAEANIVRARLDDWLRVTRKELKDFKKPTHKAIDKGLVICNPPYGERLGEIESLKHLYKHLGDSLIAEFDGWRAGIFTANPELGRSTGLRAKKKYKFFNGALASELIMFEVDRADEQARAERKQEKLAELAVVPEESQLTDGAKMVANRLKKNLKQLAKWAKKEGVENYRIYDADIPEYACAIDLYKDTSGNDYVHVQEYQAPKTIDPQKAMRRFDELCQAVPYALQVSPDNISYKERRRNKGSSQYEKLEQQQGEGFTVSEGQARIHVDLWKYLDTGLFLDHRPIRLKIAEMARDKRFLNLFCYTGVASIQAALGGARYTVSVDMSNTYLNWLRKNLALNGLSESKNRLIQADCTEWLREADQEFDVIMLDPPSFSNSKRMQGVLDIQRDHVVMIKSAMAILAQGGTLIFSNNLKSFKLDDEALADFEIENYHRQSLGKDFERNPKIHHCWLIRHKS